MYVQSMFLDLSNTNNKIIQRNRFILFQLFAIPILLMEISRAIDSFHLVRMIVAGLWLLSICLFILYLWRYFNPLNSGKTLHPDVSHMNKAQRSALFGNCIWVVLLSPLAPNILRVLNVPTFYFTLIAMLLLALLSIIVYTPPVHYAGSIHKSEQSLENKDILSAKIFIWVFVVVLTIIAILLINNAMA